MALLSNPNSVAQAVALLRTLTLTLTTDPDPNPNPIPNPIPDPDPGQVRVWDVRKKAGSAMTVDEEHGLDINVMSWNGMVNYLVATGV